MSNEIQPRGIVPAAPVHPLAAFATIVLDGIFFMVEVVNPFIAIGIGVLGFTATTLVQRFVAGDSWGAAIAKGMVLGIVAGVPFPVAGTAVGLPLLAWAGLSNIRGSLPSSGNNRLINDTLSKRDDEE
jgi:hypothetical protein